MFAVVILLLRAVHADELLLLARLAATRIREQAAAFTMRRLRIPDTRLEQICCGAWPLAPRPPTPSAV